MANYYNISLEEHMANCTAPLDFKAAESCYGRAKSTATSKKKMDAIIEAYSQWEEYPRRRQTFNGERV